MTQNATINRLALAEQSSRFPFHLALDNMADIQASQELLQKAAALEHSDLDAAGDLYTSILERDPACLAASNALERLRHPRRFSRWMHVNCTIHSEDDIFRFFQRDPGTRDPIRSYLADGWRTLSELMVLLERLGKPLLQTENMLEFASGYGRFTRHLAPLLPDRLTCADVLPGSVEFCIEQFGVKGFRSSFEPAEIEFAERFDLVFVLSLFTHLPVSSWGAWLNALAATVAPGGLLVMSFHNERAARELGVEFDQDGICYLNSSESPSLDPALYGTCLTTREVVEQEIEAALGRRPDFYQPTAFWIGQDAVVMKF